MVLLAAEPTPRISPAPNFFKWRAISFSLSRVRWNKFTSIDAEIVDAKATISFPASAAVFPLTDMTGDSALSRCAAAARVAVEAAGIVLSPRT
jgi:hypothetical protein